MTILENTQVVDFLRSATVARVGVATSVNRLRVAFERIHGKINKAIFLTELGRGGFKLVEVGGIVLVCDVALPDESAAA